MQKYYPVLPAGSVAICSNASCPHSTATPIRLSKWRLVGNGRHPGNGSSSGEYPNAAAWKSPFLSFFEISALDPQGVGEGFPPLLTIAYNIFLNSFQ